MNRGEIESEQNEFGSNRSYIIVPDDRIASLHAFYGKKEIVVLDEDLAAKDRINEDTQGKWATSRFAEAAKKMCLTEFVIKPIGLLGYEIPTILSKFEYEKAYRAKHNRDISNLETTFELRTERVDELREELIELKKQLERTKASFGEKELSQENSKVLKKMKENVNMVYDKWLHQSTSLNEDQYKVSDLIERCRKSATKQHDEDLDARARLDLQLNRLKSYLAILMKKVPIIASVVNTVDKKGRNPYDELDLRTVYANLVNRFRANDQIGVATALVAGMKIEQGTKTLAELMTEAEIFRQDMSQLGVANITMDDITALIVIKGMTDAYRDEFLKECKSLILSAPYSDEEEEKDMMDSQSLDGRSISSKKRERERPLLETVKRWIGVRMDLRNLKGKFNMDNKPIKSGQSKEEAKRVMLEAQQVYATYENNADKSKGECFAFQKNGKCSKGDACRFSHNAASKERKNCAQWDRQGKCSYGEKCIYKEGHITKPKTAVINSVNTQKQTLQMGIDYDVDADNKAVNVLIVQGDETVLSVAVPEQIELVWDTAASINVAKDLKLLKNYTVLESGPVASGVGGKRRITHEGYAPVFDMKMSYLEGGTTPNLKSMGRTLSEKGGCALFSGAGAVQIKDDVWVQQQFRRMIIGASKRNLIVGKAKLKNFVYVQDVPRPVIFSTECDNVEGVKWASNRGKEITAEIYAVNVNLFAGRVKLDSVDNLIHMLVAAGLTEAALVSAIKNKIVGGIPEVVTKERVTRYFKDIGRDVHQMEADMTTAVLRTPIDYEVEHTTIPGECMQMDSLDPPFSRIPVITVDSYGRKHRMMKHIPAIGGYIDAVLCIDEASGYVCIEGRANKKYPQNIVQRQANRWLGRWGNLQVIKADKEFVTRESRHVLLRSGVKMRQGTPGDHRRIVNKVEGAIRWIQDLAQGNMNRLRPLVEDKIITAETACSFWLLALNHAVMAWNMRPSLVNPMKSRFEEGTGDAANLSYQVMMPFGMRVVGKNLRNDEEGRGSHCIYLGPSLNNRAGIITYCMSTGGVQLKYSFRPVQNVERPTKAMEAAAGRELYGRLKANGPPKNVDAEAQQQLVVHQEPVIVQQQDNSDTVGVENRIDPVETVQDDNNRPVVAEAEIAANVRNKEPPVIPAPVVEGPATAQSASAEPGEGSTVLVRKKKTPVISDYGTRSRAVAFVLQCTMIAEAIENNVPVEEVVYAAETLVETEEASNTLPTKPTVPSNRECQDDPRWIAADLREASKLNEEEVFHPLPVDENGKYIMPPGAIVLRLLRRREYKRKVDPESKTGEVIWLECCRFVCDGSVDKRPGNFYAETPDRSLLMMMISIGASLGEHTSGSDVERAYLNAQSIDRNIVIIAPKDMRGVPHMSLLNKGLYGSRGGALSWEKHINDIMENLKYKRMDVARGTYIKMLESGEPLRAYRHSDDFLLSSKDAEGKRVEETRLRSTIRMAPFTPVTRFLGCTFERMNYETGEPDELGTIVMVRQVEKINEMESKYKHLRQLYNPKEKVRLAALPMDALKEDDALTDNMSALLDEQGIKEYQGICGCIGWVVGCTRVDAKFAYFILATRLAKPRQWDMWLATWVVDYLIATKDAPLILGGPNIDPEVWADASFASLNAKGHGERRSVTGHFATTGNKSGAIIAQVSATACAVPSIWEAEIVAALEGVQSALYCTNVCTEMGYPAPPCRTIRVDNQAEIDWVHGSVSTKRSRHIDIKLYTVRHMYEQKKIVVKYATSEENIADILTKPLAPAMFRPLAAKILGHSLIKNPKWLV